MAQLSKAELAAIEYLGRHRKSQVRVGRGKPISRRTFNQLARRNLAMWLDREGCEAMLTAGGERIWTQMHPHSKYKIR